MRSAWVQAIACLVIAVAVGLSGPGAAQAPTVDITVHEDVVAPDVLRLGINIGQRTWWGAAQYLTNLVDDPGFEDGTLGSTFTVLPGATPERFQVAQWDTAWNNELYGIGQPAGFWDGATFEIVTGPAAGATGTIASFTHEPHAGPPPAGRYTFYPSSPLPTAPLEPDIINVRTTLERPPRVEGTTVLAEADASQPRPGSAGTQSLRLHRQPDWTYGAQQSFYMDSLHRDGDPEAGKMLVINGTYRLSFWARGQAPGDVLTVHFEREGAAPFFAEDIPLTPMWQHIERTFSVAPGVDDPSMPASPPYRILVLGFGAAGSGGDVWIDDVWFGKEQQNPTVFTDALVERYQELRPGSLRYWGGQHGTTLDDQLAPAEARRNAEFRPASRAATSFHFGLHEFLELADLVGAEPWYVVPTVFDDAEWADLVAYLAAPPGEHPYADVRVAQGQEAPWTQVFPTIRLELGNEMWNSVFDGAALGPWPERTGAFATARFPPARASPWWPPEGIELMIGGQSASPWRVGQVHATSAGHDAVALAPYFVNLLDTWDTDERIFYSAFAGAAYDAGPSGRMGAALQEMGPGGALAVYEINFHTTLACDGAPLSVRNDLVSGTAQALALPLHMLTFMRDNGVRVQNAFSTAQWAYGMDACGIEPGGQVYLWGLLRDLEASGRKRPGWLGLEAVNRGMGGDMVGTTQVGVPTWTAPADMNGIPAGTGLDLVQSFAFRDGNDHALVLFNLDIDTARTVRLHLPAAPAATGALHRVSGPGIHADNEDSETVRLTTQTIATSEEMTLVLPAASLSVLQWSDAQAESEYDSDGDGVQDATDKCPTVPDPDQADLDLDGVGDACDADMDGDGVPQTGGMPTDNCPTVPNADQADEDEDGVGDACDGPWHGMQAAAGENVLETDGDHDGIPDLRDNCPGTANRAQADADGRGLGDACSAWAPDRPTDHPPPDVDGDGVLDPEDVCPSVADPGQADMDRDGTGDACDLDLDGDGIPQSRGTRAGYNCPIVPNPDQADRDDDGIGDACDARGTTPIPESVDGRLQSGPADTDREEYSTRTVDAGAPGGVLLLVAGFLLLRIRRR